MLVGYDSPIIWTSNPLFQSQQTRANEPQSHPRGVTSPCTRDTPTVAATGETTPSLRQQAVHSSPLTPAANDATRTDMSVVSEGSDSLCTTTTTAAGTRSTRMSDSQTGTRVETVSDDSTLDVNDYKLVLICDIVAIGLDLGYGVFVCLRRNMFVLCE